MDPTRLAVELSARLSEHLPPGSTVVADGDMLWFSLEGKRRGGSYACQWLNSGQGSVDALTVRACELALNDLQDFVTEQTTGPWPATRGQPPRPGARLVDQSIELWFGPRDDPVVRLRPLFLEGKP